jgi:DNA-binding response OmpR family regulator
MNAKVFVVPGDEFRSGLSSFPSRASDLIVIQVAKSDGVALQTVMDRINIALADPPTPVEHVVIGSITIDFVRRRVTAPDRSIHLTTQEFDVMRYLVMRRNEVVSRDDLLRDVWKYGDAPLTRSVDNAIARLRKKIEPCPQNPTFIHTVHRDGYRFVNVA